MELSDIHTNTMRRPAAFRSRSLMTVMGVGMLALALFLGSCGEGAPAGVVTSASGSAGTTPPETVSPMAPSGLPKLVDLGSNSCVPCQMMAPELEALAQEYAGVLDVVVVDIYKSKQNQALANELRIRVIPTQIWLDPEGKELLRHDGYISKEDIVSRFKMLGYPLTKTEAAPGGETGGSGGNG